MKVLLMIVTFVLHDGPVGFQWLKAPIGETMEHCKTVSAPLTKKGLLEREEFLDIDTHCVILKVPMPKKEEKQKEEPKINDLQAIT